MENQKYNQEHKKLVPTSEEKLVSQSVPERLTDESLYTYHPNQSPKTEVRNYSGILHKTQPSISFGDGDGTYKSQH